MDVAASEVLEWKVAAEEVVTENSRKIAALSNVNQETREENDGLVGDIDMFRTKLEETLDSANELCSLAAKEKRKLESSHQGDVQHLELFQQDQDHRTTSSITGGDQDQGYIKTRIVPSIEGHGYFQVSAEASHIGSHKGGHGTDHD